MCFTQCHKKVLASGKGWWRKIGAGRGPEGRGWGVVEKFGVELEPLKPPSSGGNYNQCNYIKI